MAEILWPDGGLLAGEHIGFDVAKGRLGLAVGRAVEVWMISSVKWAGRGVSAAYGFAFGVGELGKRNGFIGKRCVTVGKESHLNIALSTRIRTLSIINRCGSLEHNKSRVSFLLYNPREL